MSGQRERERERERWSGKKKGESVVVIMIPSASSASGVVGPYILRSGESNGSNSNIVQRAELWTMHESQLHFAAATG